MRLIDADVLKDNISKKPSLNLFIHAKNIEAAIDETPTIDAEPVRHGRWKEPYPNDIWDCYECSCCGVKYDRTWNYCPNCGAKMDLEVQ